MRKLTFSEIKTFLRPWAYRKFDPLMFDKVLDAELVNACNSVAEDINEHGQVRIERYQKNSVSGQTNYEMQGNIHTVYFFEYRGSDWKTQAYVWINDVIVLKNDPASDQKAMDIIYLRDVEKITDTDTDEIDLPPYLLESFLDLLKIKLLCEFGDEPKASYINGLDGIIARIQKRRPNNPMDALSTKGHWATYAESGTKYDITDQLISQDSVTTLDTSDIVFAESAS